MAHRSAEQLAATLDHVRAAPVGVGTVEMIVRRPQPNEREIVDEAELSATEGVVGDSWHQRPSSRTDDGSAHPDMQLNIIGWRAVNAFAPDSDDERALAGDQLYVDLALDDASLPPWTFLTIGAERGGTAVIQITDQPHKGCAKFTQRFGLEALRWVNGAVGTELHLRGVNAKVATPGVIRRGDSIAIADAPG